MRLLAIIPGLALLLALVGCADAARDYSRPSENCPAPTSSVGNPVPLVRVPPSYPAAAIREGIEGRVMLAFDVARDGRPVKIEAIAAEPPGYFDDAAVEMMKDWRYCPLRDGDADYPKRIRQGIVFSFPS